MKGLRWALIFWCSLLLASSSVLAVIDIKTYPVGDGFSLITGAEPATLCQCETLVDSFTVKNTGQYANKYTVEFSSALVSMNEASFELLPQETKKAYWFVQAPCEKLSSETVTFTVKDLFGNEQSFKKSYAVERCQNLEATLAVDADGPVRPCETVTYEVFVKNTGVFTETYDLSFGGRSFAESFTEPYQTLIIPPGKTGKATGSLRFDCSVSGKFTIPFKVASHQSGLIAELEHTLEVLPIYGFSINSSSGEACALEQAVFPITIANDAPFENTFDLTLSAPRFIALERASVTIPAEGSAVVKLIVTPGANDKGDASFTLTVAGSIGGERQQASGTIRVHECYGASINIDLQQDVQACSGYVEYPVIVKNTGSLQEELLLEVWGTKYAKLSENNISLGPGEEELVMLALDVPFAVSTTAQVMVKAFVAGKDVVAQDVVLMSFLDEQSCHQPVILENRARIKHGDLSAVFSFKNAGRESASYEWQFVGPSWLALDPTNTLVALGPGEQSALSLLTYQEPGETLAKYEGLLQAFVKSADGENVLVYKFPVVVTVHKENFLVRLYRYFSAHPCQLATLVLLLFLIIAGLFLLTRPDLPRKENRELTVILLLLWLGALIVVLLAYGLPKPLHDPLPSSNDSLAVVMAEDSSYSLDLSSFFIDPDDDLLSFAVSDMENVFVAVKNSTATFTPDADWAGSRRFRIIAYDGFGGVTESPRMALQVVDRPELTCGIIYARYCGYVNLFLLLFVAFFIILLARTVDQKAVRAMAREMAEPPAPKKAASKAAVKRAPRRRLLKRKK